MSRMTRFDRLNLRARFARKSRSLEGSQPSSLRKTTSSRRQFTFEVLENRLYLSASPWTPASPAQIAAGAAGLSLQSYTRAIDFDTYSLDTAKLHSQISTSLAQPLAGAPTEIAIPNPDGGLDYFTVYETQIMAPELAAKFPDIKTYAGQGITNPAANIVFDFTPQGFHAQVLSPEGAYYVDPYYHLDDHFYSVYAAEGDFHSPEFTECFGDDAATEENEDCGCGDNDLPPVETYPEPDADKPTEDSTLPPSDLGDPAAHEATGADAQASTGNTLRTYRLAVAATAEYTAFHGGTVALAQAAIVTAVNRVSGIYQTELSIRMQLVANNDQIIYTDAASDPYTNNNGGTMLGQNQTTIDEKIGSANYDIGHVFSTGGGGVASLGVVGINGFKARGVTGLFAPTGDVFYIDFVAHEMGHQFGAEHTFAGDSGSCAGNANPATAYEPGSGTTIMAYAGICGNDDIQAHSDPFFHSASFDEIIAHVDQTIPNVGTRTSTGNAIPTVDAGANYVIPALTPFKLTATGSDANSSDVLTYEWEQRDLGGIRDLSAPDNGSEPLFRAVVPTTDPSRTFPNLPNLLNNTTSVTEELPSRNRIMKFRAIVRDNRVGGGGVNSDDVQVSVVSTGAAFAVTTANTTTNWSAQSSQTITWNVAGTNVNGINTLFVNIRLSTDGGLTFPTLLVSATPNDGSADIILPNVITSQGRIKVEPVGNVYFDINNANISITAPIGTDDYGDAPTAAQSGFVANYPTTSLDNGAHHLASGPRLGAARDVETDGQPSALANADDLAGGVDDEDGVAIASGKVFASTSSAAEGHVQVNLQNPDGTQNRLDGWIDFNRDGDWSDPGEQIFTSFDLGIASGVQSLTFTVPQDTGSNVELGNTFARFRLSTAGGLAPTGAATNGEVEDLAINLVAPEIVVTQTGGNTQVVEGGAIDTYTIALSTNPTGPVEITITADAETEISLDGVTFAATQIFTSTTSAPQTITVRAVDDAILEGPHSGSITHAITGAVVDTDYPLSETIQSVNVSIGDNELGTFERLAPLGSAVFVSSDNPGSLPTAASTADFGFELNAGERVSALFTPVSNVILSVDLIFDSVVIATYTSPTSGEPLYLPPTLVTADGPYTLRVSTNNTTSFKLDVYLNTEVESQVDDTSNGNELNISNSSIPIGGANRYAVIGNSQASTATTLQFTKTNDPSKFIDISTTGTALNLTDDGEATITTTVGNEIFPAGPVTVGNNGGILAGGNLQLDYINAALPVASLPAALLPFWDDIDSDSGNVYWDEQIVDGINTLIVQWESRPHYDNTDSGTFQLQLFKTGPVLARYVYKDVDFGSTNYSFGATATIGIQFDPATALEFSSNSPSIANGDVLELSLPVANDIDEYEIDLTGKVGHHIDIVLADLLGDFQFAGDTLELISPDGDTILATAVSDPLVTDTFAANFDLSILDYEVLEGGVYTLRLNSTTEGNYGLVVTDSAVFDTEFNDDPSEDPIRSVTQSALGFLDVDIDEDDYYKIELAANQNVIISTQTPADASELTENTLDPELEIIAPDGTTVVITDLDTADGKNALVDFIASQAGTYLIHVRATDGAGEYTVQISSPPQLPGDYNQNNELDAADYVLWRKALGSTTAPFFGADGNGNGSVGQEDYEVWSSNFGETFPRPAGSGTLATPSDSSDNLAALWIPNQSLQSSGLRNGSTLGGRSTLTTSVSDDALLAWLAADDNSDANAGAAFVDDFAADDLATADVGTSADTADRALDLLAESNF
jgi:hypothetical protein